MESFNFIHPRSQFTIEKGTDNKLYFLDVIIINNDRVLEFDWFHKDAFSERYLNFSCNILHAKRKAL